ncbi:hypothetical protein NFI95_08035 [Acetobacteraceae bacterium KSS8]|uniref:Uncharacterized protein n=1 Tax=Endosaccharibacter trunci TaxID=2812733 RepID=A0ABT1W7L7_9PROT|nr:hypothetical protein [Acetobacteraceae bacterium KSS8]
MMQDETHGPSATEDVPSAPGWVESRLDEILSALPSEPALTGLRNAYLDCVAAVRSPEQDLDTAHDRCRSAFLSGLEERLGTDADTRRALEQKLEALEDEISERI